jgi:hypothetical protein
MQIYQSQLDVNGRTQYFPNETAFNVIFLTVFVLSIVLVLVLIAIMMRSRAIKMGMPTMMIMMKTEENK